MKLNGWMIGVALLLSSAAFGQNEPEKFQEAMAKMKAERVAFMTEKLQLTIEEAEKFWPLYNEYLSKREEMMWGKRQKMPRKVELDQLNEEEMESLLNDLLDEEVKLAQLKKDYFTRLKSVVPVRKVLKLHRVEQEFMSHMLNKIRDSHGPSGGRGSRGEIRVPLD